MQLVLPWPPSELSPNARGHWTKRLKPKQTYFDNCYILACSKLPTLPEGKIPLSITFYPPRNIGDIDNFLASFKSGLDGVCAAWMINDRVFRPMILDVGESGKPGKIILEISNV